MAASPTPQPARPKLKRRIPQALFCVAGVMGLWWVFAYLAAPDWWKRREHHEHPALAGAPKVASTPAGIPGDPLNLFIVGSEEQLVPALLGSGWHPADPVTLKTSLRIAEDSVLRRSYEDAPVSALMLFGRKQDMAFEKPAGADPRKRHHVRFWKAPVADARGREAWWGAVTFDRSEGLSRTTGEITHHIAPDIDRERDRMLEDIRTGGSAAISYRDGFQNPAGKNGGGDPWRSDGRLGVAVLGEKEAK